MTHTDSNNTWSLVLDRTIAGQLHSISHDLAALGADTTWLADVAHTALQGGKRLRAELAYQSWLAHGPGDNLSEAAVAVDSAIAKLAAVLEIFQAAALVHDDLIDNSDTRRGHPAAHVNFAQRLHSADHLEDNERFGQAGAILLGDLLLIKSDELFSEVIADLDAARAQALSHVYDRMRFDVTAGQYLDALGEALPLSSSPAELSSHAWRVIALKTVSYSVRAPLQLGAALAGASTEQLQDLEDLAVPLGEAFQLRDDLLGVFGDAAVTGKSTASDLDSAKRTVLLASALENAKPAEREYLVSTLTGQNLSAENLSQVSALLVSSGARDHIEMLISQRDDDASATLAKLRITAAGRDALEELIKLLTSRNS